MELNSIQIKTETVPLNLIWVREESSKAGMKDLPPWKEEKEQHLSAHLIMPMEKEVLLQEFHQTQLYTLKSSYLISKIKLNKNGKWAINKKFLKQQPQRIKETKLSKKEILNKQTNFIKKVLNLLKMMIILKLLKFLKFLDWMLLNLKLNQDNTPKQLTIVLKFCKKMLIIWKLFTEEV